jgi:ABC-2 type transport system permease protein
MLRKEWLLIQFNLKSVVMDLRKVLLLFVLPTIVFLIIGVFLTTQKNIDHPTDKISIGIVDLEQSAISHMLMENITEETTLANLIDFLHLDWPEAERTLKNGEITAFVVIPENFSTGLLQMENPPLQVVYDGKQSIEFFIIHQTVESFSKYVTYVEICTASQYYALIDLGFSSSEALAINDRVSFQLIMDTLGRKNLFSTTPIYDFPSVSSFVYHGVSILTLIMFYTATLGALSLLDEKQLKIVSRVRLSSVGLFRYYLFKVLVYASITTFWMFGMVLFIQKMLSLSTNLLLLFLFISMTSFCLNAFFLIISEWIGNRESYLSFSSFLIVVFAFIGGTFFPVVLLPYTLKTVTSFSPNLIVAKQIIFGLNGQLSAEATGFWSAAMFMVGLLLIKLSSQLGKREGSL